MLPFLAIFRHDLRILLKSWLVRIWFMAAALLALVLLMSSWAEVKTAPMIASLMVPWLVFPWFVVVMVLGVNPITGSRTEALADGFLSRPIARHEYLLAVWAARLAVVLGTYLIVTAPAVCVAMLAKRPAPADHVTLYGVVASMAVVALVLALQVSLAFLMGTLLRKALLAVVVLLFLWYPVNAVLHTFRLEAFSPITLSQTLPTLLRQSWRTGEADLPAPGTELEIEELKRQAATFLSVLSGGAAEEAPRRKPGFFEQNALREFSLTKVLLGYGVPAIASLGLALVAFWRRDL